MKKSKLPILITGLLGLFLSPAVLYFSDLAELDSIHPPAFQSADVGASSIVFKQAEKTIGSTSAFEPASKTGPLFHVQFPTFSLDLSVFNSKRLVLRC